VDLHEACVHRNSQRRSGIVRAQLKPGAEPRLLIVGRVVGELDAEMTAAGETDQEHRVVDTRILNHPHRTPADDGLKTPDELIAPLRSREDVHVVAKNDHAVADPSTRHR
jgi:hypothetical protein